MRSISVVLFSALCFIASYSQTAQPTPPAPANPSPKPDDTKKAEAVSDATPDYCKYLINNVKYTTGGIMTSSDADQGKDAPTFGSGPRLWFRFCSGPLQVKECKDKNAEIAFVQGGNCYPVSLVNSQSSTPVLYDTVSNTAGFNLTYSYDIQQITKKPKGTLVFSFRCGDSAMGPVLSEERDGIFYVTVPTTSGCGKVQEFSGLRDVFGKLKGLKYALGGILLVLALIYTFLGYKFIKCMFASIGFLIGYGFLMLIFWIFTNLPFWTHIVAILNGCLFGFIAVKLITCAYVLLGAVTGGMLGTSFMTLVQRVVNFFIINWFLYIIIVALVIGGGYIAWKLKRPSLVIITSILGGFLLGLSLLIMFSLAIWILAPISVLFMGAGIFVQWKGKKQVDEAEQGLTNNAGNTSTGTEMAKV